MRTLFGVVAVSGLVAVSAACRSPVVRASVSTTTVAATTTTTTTTTTPITFPPTTVPGSSACGVVPSPDVMVTSGTEPCAVSTHVRATVHVILDPGFDWGTPESDSTAIEVVDVVRHSSGRLDADLMAVRAGQATVSAAGSVHCPAEQACPALARLWEVRVTVDP